VDVQVHGPIASTDEGSTPQHQAQLRSYLDLTDDLELNGVVYYVDEVPALSISDYLRLDVGLTWRVTENFELSLWGQNLLDSAHSEFSAREVERGAYLRATFRF
jgi:iron complex outermembrane receptor protein